MSGTLKSSQQSSASGDDSTVWAGTAAAIIDASGNQWTITSGGQVAINGVADAPTANVTELAYVNGTIWQENSSDLWWNETAPNDSWAPAGGTPTSPLTTSPNDTAVPSGFTVAIVDASGKQWTITSGDQVAVNGVADTATANVQEIAYVNGTIWQENTSDLWWGKATPTASWLPSGGTSVSPLPTTTATAPATDVVAQASAIVVGTTASTTTASTASSFSPSGQGGYLLPAGYLSTSGNQIVDSSGVPVRIDSIGWDGTDGAAGMALNGLDAVSYQTMLNAILADGFNTVRIPWSDVDLTAMPNGGSSYGDINFSLNPALQGLDTLQVFQQIVAYAGSIGLKIIFDHHTDNGGPGGGGGQQVNGLWFDSGPGSNGTDGSGTTGTVTAAKFEQDSVTLAQTFAGNSTVIGFDLDNEPIVYGNDSNGTPITWGGGGPTDIHAMYQTVGDAIQAVDPGALIICEGPIQVGGTLFSGAPGNTEGDLSLAGTDPVVLGTPDKVVYSVHEYPSTITGAGADPDSGAGLVANMNTAWGYLETNNIAPVWIGEMGGSLDGTADSAGAGLADEQAWATTLLGYMNGQDGAEGGPTFTGDEQPISGSWWLAGSEPGEITDGIQSALGVGNYRAGQQAVTDQMLFIPKATPTPTPTPAPPPTPTPTPAPTPTPTPSPNDTVVKAGSTAAIADASGNKWTITSGDQVAVNGTADTTTSNVIELAYVNGTIWQENSSDLWWNKTSSTAAAWSPTGGTSTSPLPDPPPPTPTPTPAPTPTPTPSPNDTVVKAGSTAAIADASGNKWTITSGDQVAVNGTADTTTSNVIELAYVNGTIWQENSSDLWWNKTSSTAAAWSPTGGTSTSPLPVAPTPTPTASPNDTMVLAGASTAVVDASGNNWTITSTGQVAVNGVTDTTTANVTELAYVNKEVWQENASGLWWDKTSPTSAWSPTGGTSTSPLPKPVTIPAGTTSETVSQSQISVVATTGTHMLLISGSGDIVNLSGAANTITDTGSGNTYILPAAGKGTDTFTNNILTIGDTLDLKTALAATNWNGANSTLSNYLTVADTTKGAVFSIASTSGGAGVTIGTIDAATTASLTTLLAHAIV